MEKRHILLWPVTPTGLPGGRVPKFLYIMNEVIVRLCIVGGIVSSLSQHGTPRQVTRRESCHYGFTMILEATPRSKNGGGQSRPGDRTNGTVGKRMIIDQSILGQRLDVRRTGTISIKIEVMNGIVLGNKEDHVWALGQKWGNQEEKKNRKSHGRGLE